MMHTFVTAGTISEKALTHLKEHLQIYRWLLNEAFSLLPHSEG